MWGLEQPSNQKSFATAWNNACTTNNVENYNLKVPNLLYCLTFLMSFVCHSYAIRMSIACTRMCLVYYSGATRMSFVCHSYVLIYYLDVLLCHLYSYVIRISLVCTRMSSVCHSYVLVYHQYITRIYLYIIRMSLVGTHMSSVCHSYVLVCHPYVIRMYSYVIRMSFVCDFTMNLNVYNHLSYPFHILASVYFFYT